jgi:hypothetical protein
MALYIIGKVFSLEEEKKDESLSPFSLLRHAFLEKRKKAC